jgi:hypothetical protein
VRQGYDAWRIRPLHADVRTHQVELDDAEALRAVISAIRPDWIFHLAVHGAY